MRGEQLVAQEDEALAEGSSPHARGTASTATACSARRRDHPRMRGEQGVQVSKDDGLTGSSPHARGTGWADGYEADVPGIIPACAGNR